MNARDLPLRRLVLFLFAQSALITAIVGLTVYAARESFPAWFCPLFLAGTTLFLAVIGFYAWELLARRSPENSPHGSPGWLWFFLLASVPCTSSLHGFFPFRLDVVTAWPALSPDLKFIKYSYILTAVALLVIIALALLYLCGRRQLALAGLPALAGLMLLPNDDCPNAFNRPWITWLGASPLGSLGNSVVLLIGYCGLHGAHPRLSACLMGVVNAGILLLGLGHLTRLLW